jgi:hypothetical protein
MRQLVNEGLAKSGALLGRLTLAVCVEFGGDNLQSQEKHTPPDHAQHAASG